MHSDIVFGSRRGTKPHPATNLHTTPAFVSRIYGRTAMRNSDTEFSLHYTPRFSSDDPDLMTRLFE
ncbi:hypothetical protein BD311DRAFT_768185 [Dichomitus squalens]|uniref:Uncharacterized protein n=1 Tax=Dichomitus squalens TaxID=114155 RepID=A0A4Q9PMQ5_9APHY|nr:hypothetical protein BD311DRAFT_768185 [Dichomitus squalens]TBU55533.1 hypothetical protein BD310DRAFT_933601 [Dichomitus squalens]